VTGIRLRLLQPAWHPSFIDLPWDRPLESWHHDRLVDAPTGIHRHVVRFVDYDGQVYVLKELGRRPAMKEFTLLRRLNELGLPVVRMIGIVERPDLDPIVITRFLNHALPYRYVLSDPTGIGRPEEVVRSVASLLAQLHVTGFSWGDCSLSNSMVRRDAGRLSAYALDTETGEMHDRLTPGQRAADLEVAYENVAGGLADLAASGALGEGVDPFELADRFLTEYERVWDDISRDRAIEASGSIPLEDLHGLGFDVLEAVVTLDGSVARLTPVTIGEGHFRWELHRLTGLVTRERQAQVLIDEIRDFAPDLDVDLAAHRWLTEVFDPIIMAVSPADRSKLEPAELVIEVLGHRRRRAGAGVDLTPADAAREYASLHLVQRPDERVVVEG
jgi:tRNA A-37 threonylcarbamoyl transferase component Bud32